MPLMGLTEWAYSLSKTMLAEPLPRRWVHSLGVAKRARALSPILGRDAELLEAAAVLHDVGYSPSIATTGFHPLDGARFLRDQEGADERVVRLVAHHSCALLEAEERGLRQELEAEFELERPELVDALIVSDMTTTPDGGHTTPAWLAWPRSWSGTGRTPSLVASSSAPRRRSTPPPSVWKAAWPLSWPTLSRCRALCVTRPRRAESVGAWTGGC